MSPRSASSGTEAQSPRRARGRDQVAQTDLYERTVEAHVKQIFQKLRIDQAPDTNRRVLAVLAFLRGSRASS